MADDPDVDALLDRVAAALGDLTTDQLESVACRASELRQQAWTIRAVKLAAEVRAKDA